MNNKYIILLALSKLARQMDKRGSIHVAQSLYDILYDMVKDLNSKDKKSEDDVQLMDDLAILINSVGLRGDTKPEEPWGGMTVDPFFFDGGDL